MKALQLLVLTVLTLSIGFVAGRWSATRSGGDMPDKGPITAVNNPSLEQLNALISYLEANKQTNALKLFDKYENASFALRHTADMGMTLHILMGLREGRTNDAMELLEGNLDTDIIGFAAFYKELPETQRRQLGLDALKDAHWYLTKFPYKHGSQIADDGVARAFELLKP